MASYHMLVFASIFPINKVRKETKPCSDVRAPKSLSNNLLKGFNEKTNSQIQSKIDAAGPAAAVPSFSQGR